MAGLLELVVAHHVVARVDAHLERIEGGSGSAQSLGTHGGEAGADQTSAAGDGRLAAEQVCNGAVEVGDAGDSAMHEEGRREALVRRKGLRVALAAQRCEVGRRIGPARNHRSSRLCRRLHLVSGIDLLTPGIGELHEEVVVDRAAEDGCELIAQSACQLRADRGELRRRRSGLEGGVVQGQERAQQDVDPLRGQHSGIGLGPDLSQGVDGLVQVLDDVGERPVVGQMGLDGAQVLDQSLGVDARADLGDLADRLDQGLAALVALRPGEHSIGLVPALLQGACLGGMSDGGAEGR